MNKNISETRILSLIQNKDAKVFVIITCHNQLHAIKQCMASLFRQTFKNISLVVVDDGSNDGTDESLREIANDIMIVQGDGTLWWGGGTLYGYQSISHMVRENDYIYLVNCDVVLEENSLEKLVEFLKTKGNLSIAHSLTVDQSDRETIISCGSNIKNWPLFRTDHPLRGMKRSQINSVPVAIETVTARSLLIPKRVIDKVGFINGRIFPHYAGDSDFGVRCKRSGFQPFIVPRSICYLDTHSTGNNPKLNKGTLRDTIGGLFSIKSTSNLKYRWIFGRNIEKGYLRIPYFVTVCMQVFGAIVVDSLRLLYSRLISKNL